MRCDECQTEPVTPGHYCECCGRKLSLNEIRALETAMFATDSVPPAHASFDGASRPESIHSDAEPTGDPVPEGPVAHAHVDSILEAHFAGHPSAGPGPAVRDAAYEPVEAPSTIDVAADVPVDSAFDDVPAVHLDSDAPGDRCEICGAATEDHDLCAACQRTYHCLLESETFPLPTEAAIASATDAAPAVVIASEVSDWASETPAEPAAAISAEVAAPRPVSPVIDVAPPVEPTVSAAPSQPAPPKVVSPAPIAAAKVSTSREPSRARTFAAAAAVIVVIAAIGFPLGKLWLGQQKVAPIAPVQPQPPVKQAPVQSQAPVRQAVAPERAVVPPSVVQVPAVTSAAQSRVPTPPKAVSAPPLPPDAVAPRAAAARVPSSVAPKPTVSAGPTAPIVAPMVVPSPVTVAPAPEVPAPAPVVAPAPTPTPRPEPPAGAIGPFFELRDVNEAPRVASRVELQLPDDLRDGSLNEVMIVRVLVTQTGHPLIVNLLRRSKAGPSLDAAIIAAVKQWTFVPAKKRGEAVSCWYHVALPIKN